MPVEERENKVDISSKLGSSAFVPKIDEVCFLHILFVFLHRLDPIICRTRHIGSKRDLLPMWRSWKSVRFASKTSRKVWASSQNYEEKCDEVTITHA